MVYYFSWFFQSSQVEMPQQRNWGWAKEPDEDTFCTPQPWGHLRQHWWNWGTAWEAYRLIARLGIWAVLHLVSLEGIPASPISRKPTTPFSKILQILGCWRRRILSWRADGGHLSPTSHSVASFWELKIGQDGTLYAMEISKPFFPWRACWWTLVSTPLPWPLKLAWATSLHFHRVVLSLGCTGTYPRRLCTWHMFAPPPRIF